MRLYLLRGFSLFALFSWLVVLPFAASAASVVYDNTDPTRDSGQYYSSANEFGDEITLDPASTARTMSALTFYYFYDGTSAGNATLRLYDNSGVGGISQAPPIKIESGWKNLKRGRNERPRFLFHEDMSPGSRRLPDPASHRAPGRRSKPDRNGYFFSLFFGVPVPAPTLSVTTSHLPAAFDFANPPTDSPTVTASKTAGLPSLVIFVAEVIW